MILHYNVSKIILQCAWLAVGNSKDASSGDKSHGLFFADYWGETEKERIEKPYIVLYIKATLFLNPLAMRYLDQSALYPLAS